MIRRFAQASAIISIAVLAMGFSPAADFKGSALAGKAKIGIADARTIALKARPGSVTDEELETEKGGSGLRYSFDIKAANGAYEVGVDAKTGKVLENKKEGSHPD